MIRQLVKTRRRQVVIDVSTQKDFFLGSGKACIRNHRRVLMNIRRIMAWTRHNNIPIISTCQVYPNNNGGSVTDYCIDGTEGQKKIPYTLVGHRISFPADGDTYFPHDILKNYSQIILHKRCIDPFDEPRIERLLSELNAGTFILVGANAEGSVLATALGLLQRGKKVTAVIDAIGSQNNKDADLAIRKMQAKGTLLTNTRNLAGASHLRKVGICHCELCTSYSPKEFSALTPN
ncbi:MAG: cysteine hydrolase [Sedimentisphaerales bacterium]|nr:cysteine hydrolase [Sedimentisphaerales bacterium]